MNPAYLCILTNFPAGTIFLPESETKPPRFRSISVRTSEGEVGKTEDLEIIEGLWRRDEAALAALRARYGARLRRLAFGILRSEEDAEECESDACLKAWETIPPRRPSQLFAYLATLCRFSALHRLEKQTAAKRSAELVALTAELEACIPDGAAERAPEALALGSLLSDFLRTLNAESRRIFLRRYFYAEEVREIAEGLGFSEGKVKSSLHRSRKKLRAYLEKEGVFP